MGKLPVRFRAVPQARRKGEEEGVTLLLGVLKVPSKNVKCSRSRVKESGEMPQCQHWCLGHLRAETRYHYVTPGTQEQRWQSRESKLALGLGLEREGEGRRREKLTKNWHAVLLFHGDLAGLEHMHMVGCPSCWNRINPRMPCWKALNAYK